MNEAQDTRNVDSRSTPRVVYSFNQRQSGKKLLYVLLWWRQLQCWDVEHFLCRIFYNGWASFTFACFPIHLSLFHSFAQPRVKNPSIKAFYSWTMLNLFRVGLACEIESLFLTLLPEPRSTFIDMRSKLLCSPGWIKMCKGWRRKVYIFMDSPEKNERLWWAYH